MFWPNYISLPGIELLSSRLIGNGSSIHCRKELVYYRKNRILYKMYVLPFLLKKMFTLTSAKGDKIRYVLGFTYAHYIVNFAII